MQYAFQEKRGPGEGRIEVLGEVVERARPSPSMMPQTNPGG